MVKVYVRQGVEHEARDEVMTGAGILWLSRVMKRVGI